MRHIWTTALASFSLVGFAAVVSAAAIAASAEHPDHAKENSRTKMVEASYRLAQQLKR